MTHRAPAWTDPRKTRCVRPEWFAGWSHARPSRDVWLAYVDCRTPDGQVYTVSSDEHATPLRAYLHELHGLRPEQSLAARVAAKLPEGYTVLETYLVRVDTHRWDNAEWVDFPPPGPRREVETEAARHMTGEVVGPATSPQDVLWFPCVIPKPPAPSPSRLWWRFWS